MTNLPGWGFVECNGQELVLRFSVVFFSWGKIGEPFGEAPISWWSLFLLVGGGEGEKESRHLEGLFAAKGMGYFE